MRRSLVLTDETAGHPFLASLAPHIRRGKPPVVPGPRKWRLSVGDLRDFTTTYCAAFLAVSIYIF